MIDFFVKKEVLPANPPDREKAAPGIVLSAPALGLRIELVELVAPASCWTEIRAAAQSMTVSCGFSPSSFNFVVRRDGERILFTSMDRMIAAPVTTHALRPPVPLECGTRLVFHRFRWRDPKWAAFGPACENRCYEKKDLCEEPCVTNLTDETGELTAEGSKCSETCRVAFDKCSARC